MTNYRIHHADCFDWLRGCPRLSIHAVCTDPPYGLIEFTEKELSKLRNGRGDVWRLPPAIGGHKCDPFMGSGSTIAAAEATGYQSIGIEADDAYFRLAGSVIPTLGALYPTFDGSELELDAGDYPQEEIEENQLTLALDESPARYRARKR